jgi:hypothetical protein
MKTGMILSPVACHLSRQLGFLSLLRRGAALFFGLALLLVLRGRLFARRLIAHAFFVALPVALFVIATLAFLLRLASAVGLLLTLALLLLLSSALFVLSLLTLGLVWTLAFFVTLAVHLFVTLASAVFFGSTLAFFVALAGALFIALANLFLVALLALAHARIACAGGRVLRRRRVGRALVTFA